MSINRIKTANNGLDKHLASELLVKIITIENNNLRVKVLPELGGKIISIFYKENDFELVAAPNACYCRPDINLPFEEGDASGFDDAFPTILPCEIHRNGKVFRYTDHGEIWRKPFKVFNNGKDDLELMLTYSIELSSDSISKL